MYIYSITNESNYKCMYSNLKKKYSLIFSNVLIVCQLCSLHIELLWICYYYSYLISAVYFIFGSIVIGLQCFSNNKSNHFHILTADTFNISSSWGCKKQKEALMFHSLWVISLICKQVALTVSAAYICRPLLLYKERRRVNKAEQNLRKG